MTAPAIFPDLARYDRYAIDTETTGLAWKDKPVGMSLSLPDGNDFYFAWGHELGGNNCRLSDVIKWSRRELVDRRKTCVMFSGVYDSRMLARVGIHQWGVIEDPSIACALLNEFEPGYDLDTLGEKYLGEVKDDRALNDWCANKFGGAATRAAQAQNYWRAPADIVAPYAKKDSRMTLGLHDQRTPLIYDQSLSDIYWLETMVMPVLVRMYMAGVKVDVVQAKKVQGQLRALNKENKAKLLALAGGEVNYRSGKQMAELFDRLGIAYPKTRVVEKVRTRTTKKYNAGEKYLSGGNPSFKKEWLETIPHPIGKLIRIDRKTQHYDGTFIQGYLFDNLTEGDYIHPNFFSVRSTWGGTITGRFSSAGGLNAQNVPARDEELAALIRGMFIPCSREHQWLKADYSQIEYRFFAHYARGEIMEAYLKNPDIDFHDMVAELTGLPRRHAKNINFAKLYGAGLEKLAMSMGVSIEEAAEFIRIYEERIPESKILYNRMMKKAQRRGYVRTWGGRTNRFRFGTETDRFGRVHKGYLKSHTAMNKVLQGSAADLVKEAMVAVDQIIDWESTIMHLTVHDELDFSIPLGDEGLKKANDIKAVMENFDLRVPIKSDIEIGPDWGHCKEIAA